MQHMDSDMDVLITAHALYHSTLQGEWGEALTAYRNNASIHYTGINSSKDTALHVAVKDDKADMVAKLVHEIKIMGSLLALETKNDRKNTPLHCAAARGSLKMCKCIAEAGGGDNKLVEARNDNGETPLFLAALHGHKDAFLYLHFLCPDQYRGLWRRTSGETVLHCTIHREYFDLAFQIIHLYGAHIVGSVDERGISPLHILANKPSAFQSSSNFRWYNKLAYRWIIVEPLTLRSLQQLSKNSGTFLPWIQLPQNTQTETGTDAENLSYYGYENVPPNYRTCFDIFIRAFTFVIQLVVAAFDLEDLKQKKQKHTWCRQVLDQLWVHKQEAYVGGGSALQGFSLPRSVDGELFAKLGDKINKQGEGEKKEEWDRKESALFIAAKNGVLEILKKILKDKPGAIHETNSKGRNVLHVAVEYRQPHVFKLLMKERLKDNLIQGVDNDGNTLLHLAAKLSQYKPWHIPGSALQMQWEIKWFLYIRDITPRFVPFLPNKDQQTPVEIFRKNHENLVKEGTDWLNHTSESCSVVAALIAGVAFSTSTTIPGGTQEETGMPNLERHPAFNMFALTSLLALCCSITSLTMFLAILTSRHQPRDFRKDLPLKLLLGLSSLFVSIASILVSFSAAFFFVLKDNLKQVVFPLYAATILPLTFYAVAQFPLYADLIKAIFSKVPQASNRESEKLIL